MPSNIANADPRRLVRKMDVCLIPFLALLYLMSFLDRSNVGNARLAGLERDLNMSGLNYNTALAIFFPFYVLAEIPSNIIMKRYRPSVWIPSIMIAWGIMCALQGAVKTYAELLAVRAALGLAEGGLFPGINFYITQWYRRHECGFRMSLFFSAATAAGAFGGLLARAIMELNGARSLASWQWIFVIEGVMTVLIALSAYLLMYDYPSTASFLSPAEKAEVHHRLEADRSYLDDQYNWKYCLNALKDIKVWVHMVITFGIFSPLYSFSLFLPSIISGLGYKDKMAQLMTVPPYVVACIFCISFGWLADKHTQRALYMVVCNVLAIIGFAIQLCTTNAAVRYAGTFFAAAGIYPNVPQTVAWIGNNLGGSTKRAVGIAMVVGFGNLGGILSAYTYTDSDKPLYHRGHEIVIGLLSVSTLLCLYMREMYRRENKKRYRDDMRHGRFTGWPLEEMRAAGHRGDNAGFFRYTL